MGSCACGREVCVCVFTLVQGGRKQLKECETLSLYSSCLHTHQIQVTQYSQLGAFTLYPEPVPDHFHVQVLLHSTYVQCTNASIAIQ